MIRIGDGCMDFKYIRCIDDSGKSVLQECNDTVSGWFSKTRFQEVDNIKPAHYNKGKHDLYESWYLTRPFNEFRAIMESVAERYMKRDKLDRLEDLDKCVETLRRLREYEVRHKEENDEI